MKETGNKVELPVPVFYYYLMFRMESQNCFGLSI